MPQANTMDTILQLRLSLPEHAGLHQLTRTKQCLEGTDGKTYSTLGSVCQEGFLGKSEKGPGLFMHISMAEMQKKVCENQLLPPHSRPRVAF